jgi:hypothetical protein
MMTTPPIFIWSLSPLARTLTCITGVAFLLKLLVPKKGD